MDEETRNRLTKLLTDAQLLYENQDLNELNSIPRQSIESLIMEITGADNLEEAIKKLRQIIEENQPSAVPQDLKELVRQYETAKEAEIAERTRIAETIQDSISARRKAQKRPTLAGAVKEAALAQAEPTKQPTQKVEPKIEGVAFTPIFVALQPTAAAAFVKKVVLSPIVKPLQFLDRLARGELPPGSEFSFAVNQGVSSKDIEACIRSWQEAGAPPDDPRLVHLGLLKNSFDLYEKAHPVLTTILFHYHEFSKITNRRQISLPQAGYLPELSPPPLWNKRGGFSLTLRNALNKVGVILGIYKEILVSPDKIVVRPGRDFFFLQKISGKISFALGANKIALFVLQSTGLIRRAEPSPGIPFHRPFDLGGLKNLASKALIALKKNPLLSAVLGVSFAAIGTAMPGPDLFKAMFLASGISLAGLGITIAVSENSEYYSMKASVFLGNWSASMRNAMVSPSTESLSGKIIFAVIGIAFLVPFALAVITISTAGSAMKDMKGKGETIKGLGTEVAARPPGPNRHLAEDVVYTLTQCGIAFVNSGTWSQTEDCLNNSNLPNKELIIEQFRYSANEVGPGLQCVGFVRGVMAALGKDPGSGRDAREYLNLPTPNGYRASVFMDLVRTGDLVIMMGSVYGHMGVVIGREEKNGKIFIRVAQAWGNLNGQIQITEVESFAFDGFLRPL